MRNLSVPILYGLIVAAGLIVYFLLLSIFDLHKNPFYSVFNLVITGAGIYLAISKFRRDQGQKFKYQEGFVTGLITGFIATIIFTVFFGIYATELEDNFIEEMLVVWDTDWFMNTGMLLFTVALMGFASTFVLSLSFMQLLKDSWNTTEAKKHTF